MELGKSTVFVKCCGTKIKVQGDFFFFFFARHPSTGCGRTVSASSGQTHIAASTKHLFTALSHTHKVLARGEPKHSCVMFVQFCVGWIQSD